MIFCTISLYKTEISTTFLHVFFFLTIIGSFMNTYMFNPTKDKYYAMFIMRMNAKSYTLTDYFYAIFKIIIGFLPFTIIFGLLSNVNLWICFILPFFVAASKIVIASYNLHLYDKKGIIINENQPGKYINLLILLFLILAYALPALNIVVPSYLLLILMILMILISIKRIEYIINFNKYREMYKIVLTASNMNQVENANRMAKENVLKQITIDSNKTSNKKGFAYFNDLFVIRHSKLLWKNSKKVAGISYVF